MLRSRGGAQAWTRQATSAGPADTLAPRSECVAAGKTCRVGGARRAVATCPVGVRGTGRFGSSFSQERGQREAEAEAQHQAARHGCGG